MKFISLMLLMCSTFYLQANWDEFLGVRADFRTKARQIMNQTGEELSLKYKFSIIGTCAGMMDNVESVGMDFRLNKIVSKDEARSMVVDCVNQFLYNFNNDLQIRPFLKQYPLTQENVSVIIQFYNEDEREIYHPEISTVAAYCNKVFFMTRSREKKYGYKSEIEEPFEDALKIVQQSKVN